MRQSYYTDASASQFDQSYTYGFNTRPPSSYSPISLVARATPTTPLAIDYRMEYDPLAVPGQSEVARHGPERAVPDHRHQRERRLEPDGECANVADGSRDGCPQSRPDLDRFSGCGTATSAAASRFNYDITQSTLLNQRYVGFYNAQCCGVSFEYQAVQLPQHQPVLIAAEGSPLQHVVHAGRGRLVLKLLRSVWRRHAIKIVSLHEGTYS